MKKRAYISQNRSEPFYRAPWLKRIIGQLEGCMINEHCCGPDIFQQLRASNSTIKVLELQVLKDRLKCYICTLAENDPRLEFD